MKDNSKNLSDADLTMLRALLSDELYESDQLFKRPPPKFKSKLSKPTFDHSSGLANSSDVGNFLIDEYNSVEDGYEEMMEIENKVLEEDLIDILMDIGPATREVAPLKLKRKHKLKAKTVVKFQAPPADPTVAFEDADPDLSLDQHLFDHHSFYHLLGLSNLRKILAHKLDTLNLSYSSFEDLDLSLDHE